MDRWIRTPALALLLALLLAPGAGATAENGTVTVTAVRMTTAAIEIVPAGPTADVIAITYDTPETNKYTVTGLVPADMAMERGGGAETGVSVTVKVKNDTLPAATFDATEEVFGAASQLYDAGAAKTTTKMQLAVPILSLSRYYSLDVPDPGKTLWVDMTWEGDGDHALTVYHPDGILGTFRDGSDGKEDDRIFLRFFREGGVGTGAWTFKMTAPFVASGKNVTFQTYLE